MTCFVCGGPVSLVTGWHFADGVDYCGRCAREFAAWFKERMRRMSRHDSNFAEAAATSI